MRKMTEQTQATPTRPIYDTFVRYGFKKEADTLSVDGKPSLGHYIAMVQSTNNELSDRRITGRAGILDFIIKLRENPEYFSTPDLHSKINSLREELRQLGV